ncbi:MAG: hypothetical protein NVS1B11_37330 [Terriglobales bacterium]
MNYDREADVLYCSFGEPQEAISIETEKGIIVRQNPATNEIVGYTVVNFFKRFADSPNKSVSIPLATEVA